MIKIVTNTLTIFFYSFGITIFSAFVFICSLLGRTTLDGPIKPEYDYILVGAGTAGCTILSALESDNVLIIEAGGMTNLLFDIPILSPALQLTSYDWQYATAAQESACRAMSFHSCNWPAGLGFGGSNILNNMIYSRGHKEDYRGWFANAETYSYTTDILPEFLLHENSIPIGNLKFQTKFAEALLRSQDANIHFEPVKVTQMDGWRWSIAHTAYKNIKPGQEILMNTEVTKLLFDKEKGYRAIGVEVERNGAISKIFAKKGVILSSGTVGTAKILLHSGIGPCDDLKNISIPCRANLPVGKNLQDHIGTGLDLIHLNVSMGLRPNNLISFDSLYGYFADNGRGPLSMVGCEVIGFQNPPIGEKPEIGFMVIPLGIASDGGVQLRRIMNINDFTWNNYFLELMNTQTISIIPILLHPRSRGYIKLLDNDIHSPPIINPQYLSNSDDIELLIDGIKLVKRLIDMPELKQFGAQLYKKSFPGCEMYMFDTNDYWACYVKHLTLTMYHPVGTCQMGPANSSTTVVTQDFRVKGFSNLYVVDASVMPNLPSSNPNGAIAMIARKFARYINEMNHQTILEYNNINNNDFDEKILMKKTKIEL